MNISYLLPKGEDTVRAKKFIDSELSTARNIKDKNVRKSVEAGLRSISYYL